MDHMDNYYSNKFGFLSGFSSAFDISGSGIAPISGNLEEDMEKLRGDQNKLLEDCKRSNEKLKKRNTR